MPPQQLSKSHRTSSHACTIAHTPERSVRTTQTPLIRRTQLLQPQTPAAAMFSIDAADLASDDASTSAALAPAAPTASAAATAPIAATATNAPREPQTSAPHPAPYSSSSDPLLLQSQAPAAAMASIDACALAPDGTADGAFPAPPDTASRAAATAYPAPAPAPGLAPAPALAACIECTAATAPAAPSAANLGATPDMCVTPSLRIFLSAAAAATAATAAPAAAASASPSPSATSSAAAATAAVSTAAATDAAAAAASAAAATGTSATAASVSAVAAHVAATAPDVPCPTILGTTPADFSCSLLPSAACVQGLTLVHLSAQLKAFCWIGVACWGCVRVV